jgi:hypothetical protein
VRGNNLPGGKSAIMYMQDGVPGNAASITSEPFMLRGFEQALRDGGLESRTMVSSGVTYTHIREVELPDSAVLIATGKAKQIDDLEREVDKAVKELLGLQVLNYGANIPL